MEWSDNQFDKHQNFYSDMAGVKKKNENKLLKYLQQTVTISTLHQEHKCNITVNKEAKVLHKKRRVFFILELGCDIRIRIWYLTGV